MENFSSGLPPEPRSPDMQRFRSSDHNRHRTKETSNNYEDRPRRSRSPLYFDNRYGYRSPSPNIRPFSPDRAQMPMSPPPSHDLSPLRDRSLHSSDRPRRRRSPPRRDRSRERRRRSPPKRRTPPPVPRSRSPAKPRRTGAYSFILL